jgi:hypothetical protein
MPCRARTGKPRPRRRRAIGPGSPRARPAALQRDCDLDTTDGGQQMRSDIAPGGTLPDYELRDHESVSHDRHRRASHAPGVPRLRRRPVAVPLRPGAHRAERPRHPGVHRPRQRPDDPAHARALARARHPQRLQRLLVLGAPLGRRPLARPTGPSRARSGRTGTSALPGCATHGTRATARPSTAGTSGPRRARPDERGPHDEQRR